MQMLTKCLLACLLVLVVLFRTSAAASTCAGVISVNPKDCTYGVLRYCGKIICAKGTGEKCSSMLNSQYKCGTGNFCLCGRCHGCSLHNVIDCFHDTTNCPTK